MSVKPNQLSPSVRAAKLLSELSLDEKMAQVNGIFPFGESYCDFEKIKNETANGIGEVSTLEMRRMKTLGEVSAWQRQVQKIVMENSPHQIPAIFHMEGLCGAFIQDTTSFPSGIARGASFDPETEMEIAKIVSRQEAACGFTHILAPVLDISRDSRMGRQGETYGEDPTLAAAMGSAYTKGIHSEQTDGRSPQSVAKHFLGFHNSQGGIHGTHSDTPPRLLQEIYGKPFQAAIMEAGLKGIMPSYNSIDGVPMSASRERLTKLLREEMGFDGVCIGDYGAVGNVHSVQHVGETFEDAGLLCMDAGMDIELPNTTAFNKNLKKMFESGKADIKILDNAVFRVLKTKFEMGLFENPFALQGEELFEKLLNETDREVSLKSARESIVLLKNNGILPLKKDAKKIAVIGPHASFARKYFGGYTHLCMMESTFAIANSIAGVSGTFEKNPDEIVTVPDTNIQSDETPEFDEILYRQKPNCKSLVEELKSRFPESEIIYSYGYYIAGGSCDKFDDAIKACEKADVIILTLGGKHGACSMASMGEGVDAANINLPDCQDEFIKLAAKLNKPMIGVHFDGRPISSDAVDKYLDGIIEAWSPAECGSEAVADVIFGDYNPGGKMPVSVARTAGQIPIYYNHANGSAYHQSGSIGFANYVDLPHAPRYFFGYGLSYTSFEYSDFRISKSEINPDESLEISFKLKNTGKVSGDEVAQLYIIDSFSSMTRPVKELQGFKRVTLSPNEEAEICFTINANIMAFLDCEMRWKTEKGEYKIEIGSSSEDIRLAGSYFVKEDCFINGRDRMFYAEVKVTRL